MLPLPYQRAVADLLEAEHPKASFALRPAPGASSDELRQLLVRTTYRLDAQAHPQVHAAVQRAATALGITVPVEVYADDAGRGNNAELIYVPDRAVLVITGTLLGLLGPDELCSVAGHELAHHVVWGLDGGRYLAAARLLDAADRDARTPSEYLETARRYRLATELYADRGAFTAVGSLAPVVAGLVKITTGLSEVDVDAYLRQAAEVDLSIPSAGTSHPETVLRAWALQQWVERGDAAEDDIAASLAPQLDLGSLDILGQDRLAVLTRELVAAVLAIDSLRSDDLTELAEHFGVAAPGPAPASGFAAALAPETRGYLAAVLLDFATADPDASADVLATVLALARRVGLDRELDKMIDADLDLGDRGRAGVRARAAELAI